MKRKAPSAESKVFLREKNDQITLKWYYDENRIFPIAAILRHKQEACVRRKMLFTIFKYLIFKFLNNYAISQVMTSFTQQNFDQT